MAVWCVIMDDAACAYILSNTQALAALDEFQNLDRDIEGSAKRWKKFVEHETPEKEKFPQEWKNKSALQKLCMMRALRPDRMTYAVKWVTKWPILRRVLIKKRATLFLNNSVKHIDRFW